MAAAKTAISTLKILARTSEGDEHNVEIEEKT